MEFGGRIKAERVRLGLTQAAFSKKCSVHRNTQIKYESGEREPDAAYLMAMAEAGVDVGYVLTGKWTLWEHMAKTHVLSTIQEHLRLVPQDDLWQEALRLAYEETVSIAKGHDVHDQASRAILNVLRSSPVVILDLSTLQDVIEKLEFVLDAKGLHLRPHEKASAIISLFGELKSGTNRLDLHMVEKVLRYYA